MVTRTFDVEHVEGEPPDFGDDDLGFMGTVHPNVDVRNISYRYIKCFLPIH